MRFTPSAFCLSPARLNCMTANAWLWRYVKMGGADHTVHGLFVAGPRLLNWILVKKKVAPLTAASCSVGGRPSFTRRSTSEGLHFPPGLPRDNEASRRDFIDQAAALPVTNSSNPNYWVFASTLNIASFRGLAACQPRALHMRMSRQPGPCCGNLETHQN